MARALLPVKTSSVHWLSHPAFADAVARFWSARAPGVEDYLEQLEARSPCAQASNARRTSSDQPWAFS